MEGYENMSKRIGNSWNGIITSDGIDNNYRKRHNGQPRIHDRRIDKDTGKLKVIEPVPENQH